MIRLSDYEYGLGDQDLRRTRYSRSDYIHLQVIKTIGCVIASCILIITLISLYYMDEIGWIALLAGEGFGTSRLVLIIAAGILGVSVFVLGIVSSIRSAGKKYDESEARVKEYGVTLGELLTMYEEEQEEESV